MQKFANVLIVVLGALVIALWYNYLVMHKELEWAKWNQFQEEATVWQLMWNPVCRYPEINDPRMATMKEFCDASNGGRKGYLEWYSKTMKQPIPEFPS